MLDKGFTPVDHRVKEAISQLCENIGLTEDEVFTRILLNNYDSYLEYCERTGKPVHINDAIRDKNLLITKFSKMDINEIIPLIIEALKDRESTRENPSSPNTLNAYSYSWYSEDNKPDTDERDI